jgi:serralysin
MPLPRTVKLNVNLGDAQDFSLDPFGGTGATFRGKPILPLTGPNSVVSHIDSGETLKASNGVITFTFLDKDHLTGLYNNPQAGFTSAFGLSTYSPQQQAAARAAIQLWDDLIPQSFRETNGQGADIVFANSLDPAQAYAYYPGHRGWKFQSDVFTADPNDPVNGNWTNKWFTPGGYGNTTLVHELGHTLGLSHPGTYNYDPNVTQDYVGLAEYAQDSMQYTIMSYWSGAETGARTINWSTFLNNYAQTPMLHDILTIQTKYGADPTTRVGDTVYGFNSTAGNVVYDFAKNPFPYLSIYDAGGNDTIDASGFTVSQFIDLHAGSFSSMGGAVPSAAAINSARADLSVLAGFDVGSADPATILATASVVMSRDARDIARDTGVTGITTTEYQNVSIAYGTTIENATGGSARDLLWGNDVANILRGNGGNDVLRGFGGNDTLWGGIGNDTFVFDNNGSRDTIADFQTGLDKIDLTNILGATSNNVTFDAVTHTLKIDVDHNGTTDVSIIVLGSNVSLGADVLFHA